jgi:hypothetical protein
VKASPTTVGTVRAELEEAGLVSNLDTRTDRRGREQPATKPPEARKSNGAHAIMAFRKEPADSLDFFPTPPFATRALVERVFPELGIKPADLAKLAAGEHACGEGHMAEVLAEYFGHVIASDIHDYGYGKSGIDFLSDTTTSDADWLITNPPFSDKSLKFALKAIELARVGVAVFVRLQWLETIDRYELLFRDHPPTLVAIFVERVPLHKDNWKPDERTATAYCWVVWVKGEQPRPLFWIPPCRKLLTHPGDAERFATHPVTRREPREAAE